MDSLSSLPASIFEKIEDVVDDAQQRFGTKRAPGARSSSVAVVLAVHEVQQAAMALEVAYKHDADDTDIDVLVQNVARLLEPIIAGL
jgi:hypothetical protein